MKQHNFVPHELDGRTIAKCTRCNHLWDGKGEAKQPCAIWWLRERYGVDYIDGSVRVLRSNGIQGPPMRLELCECIRSQLSPPKAQP